MNAGLVEQTEWGMMKKDRSPEWSDSVLVALAQWRQLFHVEASLQAKEADVADLRSIVEP